MKQLHEGREAGQGFGFIRPCERAGDLFFHFSQVGKMTHCQCGARGPCMWSSCSDVVLYSQHDTCCSKNMYVSCNHLKPLCMAPM